MDAFDDRIRTWIRTSPDRVPLERASLVLTAIDIDNGIEPDGTQWRLWVPCDAAIRANAELEKYSQENRPRFVSRPSRGSHRLRLERRDRISADHLDVAVTRRQPPRSVGSGERSAR